MRQQKIAPDSVVVAITDQVSARLGEEAVVLNLESGVYHGLNPVGARIWDLLSSPTTADAVVAMITSEYDVDEKRCRSDVLGLLAALSAQGLIRTTSSLR